MHFRHLGAGTWTVTVEMFGFDTLKKDVEYAGAAGSGEFRAAVERVGDAAADPTVRGATEWGGGKQRGRRDARRMEMQGRVEQAGREGQAQETAVERTEVRGRELGTGKTRSRHSIMN